MAKRKHLSMAEQWEEFSSNVGLYQHSAIQQQEMRRAFYAGAVSIMDAIMQSLDPGIEPTMDDMNYMTSLNREMIQFGRDIAEGRA